MSVKPYERPKRKMVNPAHTRNETLALSYELESQMFVEKTALVELGFTVRDLDKKIKQLHELRKHVDDAAQFCIRWLKLPEMINLNLEKAKLAIDCAMRITPHVRKLRGELLTDFEDEVVSE